MVRPSFHTVSKNILITYPDEVRFSRPDRAARERVFSRINDLPAIIHAVYCELYVIRVTIPEYADVYKDLIVPVKQIFQDVFQEVVA